MLSLANCDFYVCVCNMKVLALILLLIAIKAYAKRSLIVPGSGCGVVKSVKMLNIEGEANDIEVSSASEAECGVVGSEEALEAVINQVEVLKCQAGQMDCADMKYNVLSKPDLCGGQSGISVSNPNAGLENIPSCTIVEKKSFELLVDSKVSACESSGNNNCLQTLGYTTVKLSPSCGLSKPNVLHTRVPYSWVNHLCVILPTELQDQEVKIVLQNLLARDDIVYDKWDTIPSVRLSDNVKDLWNSFSYSLWSTTTVPGNAHDKVINPGPTNCYIVGNQLGSWFQVEFEKIYYVTRVVVEGRKDGCCPDRFAYIEVRVGMVDTSGYGLGILTSNQPCGNGGNDWSDGTTKDYTCPRPLKGRYLTSQKTQISRDYAYTICEIYVDVIDFGNLG